MLRTTIAVITSLLLGALFLGAMVNVLAVSHVSSIGETINMMERDVTRSASETFFTKSNIERLSSGITMLMYFVLPLTTVVMGAIATAISRKRSAVVCVALIIVSSLYAFFKPDRTLVISAVLCALGITVGRMAFLMAKSRITRAR